MKDYRQFLKQLPSKTVVLACGKFNPPTLGHELLVKTVKKLAESKNADHVIYASNVSDAKKNPLVVEKKLQYLDLVFPKTNFKESGDSIWDIIKSLREHYKNIVVVTSADKVNSLKKFNVESVVIGDKDPDSEDSTRSLAAKGLYEEFKKNLPTSIRELDSRRLMNDIRIGSGMDPIKEQINLVKNELREQYFRGEIFNVGDIVECAGTEYEIVKRGSNHLLLKCSEGKLVSKWLQEVKQVKKSQIKVTTGEKSVPAEDGTMPLSGKPFDPFFKESFKEWRTK